MSNILRINNDYSFFISDNQEIKQELFDRLRFRDKNYFHNRAYKMRKWDGFIVFFVKETGKFLTGLLPEVSAVLRHFNVDYKIEDNRSKLQLLYENIDENFLSRSMPLYDYQVDITNQVIKHRRGIIYAPTGSGKSLSMVCILKLIPEGTPTLVLQNRISLAQQNYDEFEKWGIKGLGTLWGGNCNPNTITVASVQSISKIEDLLPKIRVLIVDEIHDNMSALPKAVYKRLKNCDTRIAVSATPFKFGGKDNVQKFQVRGFFGPILKIKSSETGILTTSQLQESGILSDSKCIFYYIDEPQIPHDIYIDAVTRGIAENFYFHKIVVKLAKMQKGRTLILVDRIAHGDALNNLLPGSLWVQGKDDVKTRKDVIKKLTSSKKDVIAIATSQIFNTGINCRLQNLISATSGHAEHNVIQKMGRGLRTADDKDILNYYDFVFRINKYLEDHSNKRIKILQKEGHSVEVKEIDF